MATVSHRHARRQGRFESQLAAYRRPKRRWVKRLVLLVTLLVILVLLAPTIIAYTALRSAPLRLALNGIKGSVTAGGASLSWMAPIRYTDIEIRDSNGELLLALPKVESQRSLFDLVTHLSDLGTFRIERPQVSLKMRRDGSNVEDVLLPWINKPSASPTPSKPSSAGGSPALTVEIVDGTIQLLDAPTNQKWKIEKFDFKLRMSPESSLPAEVALSCQVPVDGRTAQIAVIGSPSGAGKLDRFEAKVDALPLALLRSAVDRVAPGLLLSGALSANLLCDGLAGLPKGQLQVSGSVAVDDAVATGGPLGNDSFLLHRVELPCQLSYRDQQLDVQQFGLRCDVGQIAVAGSVMLPSQFDQAALGKLARSSLNAQGEVDLAKVAALLPTTLRVRDGTQITSGVVRVALDSRPDAEGHQWTGQINASDFSAMHEGRRLTWNEPIRVELAVRDRVGQLNLERLAAQSSFLQVSGAGSLNEGQAQVHCDLDRLTTDISQFFDLGGARFAGRADGAVKWQREQNGTFHASTDAQLQALQIVTPNAPAWQEDSVVISAAASGVVDNLAAGSLGSMALRSLNSGQVKIAVENVANRSREQVDLWLAQPVDNVSVSTRWPIEARAQGQVGRWWPRIAAWLNVGELDLGGGCDVALQATCSSGGVEIQQMKGIVSNLHVWGWDTLFIDEPEARLEGSGNYEFAAGRLSLSRTTLLTSSLSLQTEAATISLPAAGPFSAQGSLAYQANLARLSRWISDPRKPASYSLAGILAGTASVAHSASGTNARVDAAVDDFAAYVRDATSKKNKKVVASAPPEPVWSEKKLTLSAAGALSHATDTIQLTSLTVGSQALSLQATGKVDGLSSKQNIELTGSVDYDWKSIGPLLEPYVGRGVKIAGRQSRKFSVRGPLGEAPSGQQIAAASLTSARSSNAKPEVDADPFAFLKPLVADVSLGWTRADVYGIRVGPVDLDAHLENGTVTTKPILAALGKGGSQGKLSAAPVIRLTPAPAEFVLGKGMLAENVEISQELSGAWLKFVAPLLAEATRAEGEFSLDLEGARIPLEDPAKSDIGGRLIVHNVSVTPGPLGQPLLLIGKQVEAIVKKRPPPLSLTGESTLLRIDDQQVDFHMVDGRVYHQGLSMQVGEVAIRTRGWVGVDETLGLVAEVPLKPEWIQRSPALAGLRDDVLRIPIEGTLRRPKIDKRVIEQLAGQLIQNTTKGLIENELNKQLDRFLPSQPQR